MIKKILALLICMALLAGLFESSADAQKKRKRAAGKKVIKKVIKKKNAKAKKVKKDKKAKKAATKKVLPSAPIVSPKPEAPAQVSPATQEAPAPVVPKVEAPAQVQPAVQPVRGGLSAGVKAGLSAGALAFTADIDYSLSNIIDNAKVRLSGNFMTGKEETGSQFTYRIGNIKIGGIYNLPMLKSKDMPIDLYAGGSFIYPVLLSSSRTGTKWGAEVFMGGSIDVAEIGTLYGELGYGGLKYDEAQPALKGISASIGLSAAFQ